MRCSVRIGLAAAVLVGVSTWSIATQAQPAPDRFAGVTVDASRLGGSRTAALLEQRLAADAREVFADRLVPGDRTAPTIVIRIASLSMPSYVGNSDRGFGGDSHVDYLEGDGLVVSGRTVRSSTHILAVLDASYSGAWTLPDIDERRVESISHQFAYWLRREMGL